MLQIAVCEDESVHIDLIRNALVHFFIDRKEDYELQVFRSAKELLAATENYDILFLDISLGDGDGIETAIRLREKGNAALFIIVTAYSDRYRDGYNATVFRYLEKPLSQSLFNKAMQDALNQLQICKRMLRIHYCSQEYLIPVHQILYIENWLHNRRVHFVTIGGAQKIQVTSDRWEALLPQLPEACFFFVQKSILVNANHIARVSASKVVLDAGESINISKSRRSEFEKSYMHYLERI